MTRFFIISLILFLIPGNASAFLALNFNEISIIKEDNTVLIHTKKIAHLISEVDSAAYRRFQFEMEITKDIPGDRVIIINSPGGRVDYGNKMIGLIKKEQEKGVKMYCYVAREAHSMAFNLLSFCDVRVAQAKAITLVHKVAYANLCDSEMRFTSANLRFLARSLDIDDEPFRKQNAKALGYDLKTYDVIADAETIFTAKTLLKRGYLHYIVRAE